jgi:hypothetical protein
MSKFSLNVIPSEEAPHENISMREVRRSKIIEQKVYKTEVKELSKNIQKFDRKVYNKNPYDYNTISLNREYKITPTASQMVANPLYNAVGKSLGIDAAKEWNQYYDKIYKITEWARERTKTDEVEKIIRYLATAANKAPSMGARRIDDIYVYMGIAK